MNAFAGKVAIVTGASRGQGAAEACAFAAAGAEVVICDLLEAQGEELAGTIRAGGGGASYRSLDVSNPEAWQAMMAWVTATFGRLDILINNAGIALRDRTLETTSVEEWNRLLAVNLTGAFLGIQAAAPLMRESGGGAVVNIGSVAGLTGHFATAYSVAKWGLRGLTKSAAMELASSKIRVNALHPGLVMTSIVGGSNGFVDAMEAATAMERGGAVEEIAAAVLFLASEQASFITGIDLPVDGGFVDLAAYRLVLSRAKELGKL